MSTEWRKSSWSAANGHCVEVMRFTDSRSGEDMYWVRDSKHPAGRKLTFTRAEWNAFLAGVRAGEFDLEG